MYRKFAAPAMGAGWILFSCLAGLAHHSVAANFDQTKTVDVVGRVKEVEIRNPHSQITLEVSKPGGGVTAFYVEWSDKNALLRRSVPVSKIHVGDMVTVSVSPSKRLPNLGYCRAATLPDGTILKDCGFAAFRDGIAKGKTGCEENTQ
jgi:Family of unknown function (DUF6152)